MAIRKMNRLRENAVPLLIVAAVLMLTLVGAYGNLLTRRPANPNLSFWERSPQSGG